MPIREISRPMPRYVSPERSKMLAPTGRPMMAGFWVLNVDDLALRGRLLPTPSILPVSGRGEPVYVGNSRSSPRYGAQVVRPGEILPIFMT